VSPEHLYGAIHDLGGAAHSGTGYVGCEAMRREAEPIVAGFLADDDPHLGYIAISVLATRWDRRHYAEILKRMSLLDPDERVREIATSNVGRLLRGTRDRDAVDLLSGILWDTGQPEWIRRTAYEGLLKIWHGSDACHRWFLRVVCFGLLLLKRSLNPRPIPPAPRNGGFSRRKRPWTESHGWMQPQGYSPAWLPGQQSLTFVRGRSVYTLGQR